MTCDIQTDIPSDVTMRIKVDETRQPDVEPAKVYVGSVRHRRIPLRNQPNALAEITGLQIARLRAIARQGVALDAEDIANLETLARTVNSISTAHTRLNKEEDKPPTEEELKRLAGVA